MIHNNYIVNNNSIVSISDTMDKVFSDEEISVKDFKNLIYKILKTKKVKSIIKLNYNNRSPLELLRFINNLANYYSTVIKYYNSQILLTRKNIIVYAIIYSLNVFFNYNERNKNININFKL